MAALALPGQPEGRRFAFENLVSPDLLLELNTQPQLPPQVDTDLIGTYMVDRMEVRVYASVYSRNRLSGLSRCNMADGGGSCIAAQVR